MFQSILNLLKKCLITARSEKGTVMKFQKILFTNIKPELTGDILTLPFVPKESSPIDPGTNSTSHIATTPAPTTSIYHAFPSKHTTNP